MSITNKLDNNGLCPACENTSSVTENVQCFVCKSKFHVVCLSIPKEDKIASKTTVSNFLLPLTKKKFLFFCDVFLTNLEINLSKSETLRLSTLECNVTDIKTQLNEIKKMLNKNSSENKSKKMSKVMV